jgi:regulator of replication initiation timing
MTEPLLPTWEEIAKQLVDLEAEVARLTEENVQLRRRLARVRWQLNAAVRVYEQDSAQKKAPEWVYAALEDAGGREGKE